MNSLVGNSAIALLFRGSPTDSKERAGALVHLDDDAKAWRRSRRTSGSVVFTVHKEIYNN